MHDHSRLSKKMTALSFPDNYLFYTIQDAVKKTFLQLYSNEYLDLLVEPKLGIAFRDYLEAKLDQKRKQFRCLVDVEEWMMRESINFLMKDDKPKGNRP